MSSKPEGECHICGVVGRLSYEHVPPRSAFNDKPVFVARGEQLFKVPDIEDLPRIKQQQGAGGYTLCPKCNNDTGGWYGRSYADWADQAFQILLRADGQPSLFYSFNIYPLRVIKQIVTMFFSVNSPNFRTIHPYLEHFVRNKRLKGLPPELSLYVGYSFNGHSRSAGVSGLLDGTAGGGGSYVFSEIAFPPFVFVLCLASPPPEKTLIDISWFALFDYDHCRYIDLRLPVLDIQSPFPGDYRNKNQIEAVKNEKMSQN